MKTAVSLSGELPHSSRMVVCMLLIPALAASLALAEQPLTVQDPKASFLDVPARRKALQSAQTPRLREAMADSLGCVGREIPQPPPDSRIIPSRYKSGSHGDVNPQEQVFSQPYERLQELAARGANRYLVSGDRREAACVLHALRPWAQSQALLHYNAKENRQLWYVAEWTISSLSLAVSIAGDDPTLDPAERNLDIEWLRQAAHKLLNEDTGPASSRNNHFFWRGLAATASGVISKDDTLFAFGLRTYATAIGEIDSNGAFPLEMDRHELALHYQAFAIAPLVMIAELARRQGIDLYTLKENGHTLSDAVGFLSKAIADPKWIRKYTPEEQVDVMSSGSQLLAWSEFWNRRFPDPSWQSFLQKPYRDSRLGGSTTLLAAPVDQLVTLPSKQSVK